MNLKQKVNRFYVDMAVNELRQAKYNHYNHINHNSLLYLDIIAYTENCTASRIAEMLHIAKSAVTLKIKELEQMGFVKKEQSKTDKRIFYLHVDDALLEEYKTYDNVLYRALDEIENTYSEKEISVFCGMLDTINRHFETCGETMDKN